MISDGVISESEVARSEAGLDRAFLTVNDLAVAFPTEDGLVRAVDGVSLTLEKGKTLAIVGESGSGKSVTAQAIMGLINRKAAKVTGEIWLDGQEMVAMPDADVQALRGDEMAMIFQDPMSSLHPFYRIGDQISEAIRAHRSIGQKLARQEALEMLRHVGIPAPDRRIDAYPHQLSGGMRQRVMIAMALSCEPELLIADEPTTALDVTIQAQILELIKKLKRETGTSVILITHDLGVVAGMTDHVIVMYAGKIFEQAPTNELFSKPGNPYTKGLLRSVPDPTAEQGKLYQIPGLPPDVAHLKPGCPFAQRCDYTQDICRREFPPFVQLNADHFSLCHFAREVYSESGGTPV